VSEFAQNPLSVGSSGQQTDYSKIETHVIQARDKNGAIVVGFDSPNAKVFKQDS
jgi:hypothetical protein